MNDLRALERCVHEALHELPVRPAPASLRPRVMDAVRARAAQPWYARTWHAWPPAASAAVGLASVLVLPLVLFLVVLWVPLAVSEASRVAAWTLETVRASLSPTLPDEVRRAITFAGAAHVVWRTVLGPVLFYAALGVVVVGGVFASGAALVTRLAVGRATV